MVKYSLIYLVEVKSQFNHQNIKIILVLRGPIKRLDNNNRTEHFWQKAEYKNENIELI